MADTVTGLPFGRVKAEKVSPGGCFPLGHGVPKLPL